MAKGMADWSQVAEALGCLPVAVREARRREGLSLRDVADLAGVSFSTVTRLESGEGVHLTQVMGLIRWLAGSNGSPSGLVGAGGDGILRAEGHESVSGVDTP